MRLGLIVLFVALLLAVIAGQNSLLQSTEAQDYTSAITACAVQGGSCSQASLDSSPGAVLDHTVFVGGGPNYATAYFAMAKWFESLTRPAHLSQLEEWAHEHYFMTRANVDTFIILPPGPGRIRGLEQARAAREMESRIIILAEGSDVEARAAADIFFPMPSGIREALTPFVYKLVFEYLSCEISKAQNIAFLGFDDRRRQEVNFRQIFHSAEMA